MVGAGVEGVDHAHVQIVPVEGAGDPVIGGLDERADVGAETAGQEQADLIDRHIVVGGEIRGRRSGRALLRVEVGGDGHDRDRRIEGHGARGVAGQFELTAERRQLRAEPAHVAGLARLPGLHGEGGHRQGRRGGQADGDDRGGRHDPGQARRAAPESKHCHY